MTVFTLKGLNALPDPKRGQNYFQVNASFLSDDYQARLSLEIPSRSNEEAEGTEVFLLHRQEDCAGARLESLKLVGYCFVELTTGSVVFTLVMTGREQEILSLPGKTFQIKIDHGRVNYIDIREI